MPVRTAIIKISNAQVFFNPEISIPFAQTDFPEDALTFKDHLEIFWMVEMKRYDPIDRKLFVNILDYNAQNIDLFYTQKPGMDIRLLSFVEKLDWAKLEPQLSYYTKRKLLSILKELPEEIKSVKSEPPFTDFMSSLSLNNYKKEIKVEFLVVP